MTQELKNCFLNMPLDITNEEYKLLSQKLFMSWNTATSDNEQIYIYDTLEKKMFCFDTINEVELIKKQACLPNNHLIQFI